MEKETVKSNFCICSHTSSRVHDIIFYEAFDGKE